MATETRPARQRERHRAPSLRLRHRKRTGRPHRVSVLGPAIWGAVVVVVLWVLGRWGVVAARPMWLLVAVAASAGAVALLGDRCYRVRPAPPTMHLRVATQTVGATVVLYLIGWGPALAIGFGFAILNNAFRMGSRSRWALMLWPIVCLAVAQVVVETAGIHLLVSAATADGLAAVDVVALVLTVLFVARLVAGKESAERELAHAASHDELTGLMNRSSFTRRLERRVAGRRRSDLPDRPLAVLFCDLVGFKAVNDRYGHEAGDRALAEVARRLAATLRQGDLLARFAGDEFVVALCSVGDVDHAAAAAERLLRTFEWPMDVGGHAVRLGISVGVVFSPTGRVSVETMLADADTAMYQAKAARRSAWSLLEVA